jgi:hypothetical protein
MNRRCFRNLDRPFEVFLGLGPLDLVLIAIMGLILMTVWNAPAGLLGGAAFGAVVRHFREGKPRGYAFTLAYKMGLVGLIPENLRPPGLLPAPGIFGAKRVRFSAVAAEADDESPEARHFWSGRAVEE